MNILVIASGRPLYSLSRSANGSSVWSTYYEESILAEAAPVEWATATFEGIVYKPDRKAKWCSALLPFMLFGSLALVSSASAEYRQEAQEPSAQPRADNSKKNLPTNHQDANRADQQSEAARDRELTRKIRQALVKDKSLSVYAHNIKIITRGGVVYLKGPVRSHTEKDSIDARATEIAGASNVKNELTVKNTNNR